MVNEVLKEELKKNYTPVGSKRVLFKDPIVQRRRGFAQLLENGGLLMRTTLGLNID